jgi:hypothetical protein
LRRPTTVKPTRLSSATVKPTRLCNGGGYAGGFGPSDQGRGGGGGGGGGGGTFVACSTFFAVIVGAAPLGMALALGVRCNCGTFKVLAAGVDIMMATK